ncbi:MAG: hypothetical protein LUG98_11230 [Tannerellaceae bacterium]|nr:hypothetical protein [Tannerellaceae bacterium]
MKSTVFIFCVMLCCVGCNNRSGISVPEFRGNVHTIYEIETTWYEGIVEVEGFAIVRDIVDIEYDEEDDKDYYSSYEPEKTESRVSYLFDEKGRMTEFSTLNRDGTVRFKQIFEYKESQTTPHTIKEYDRDGNFLGETPRNDSDQECKVTTKTKGKNVFETIWKYPSDKRTETIRITVNEQGDKIEEIYTFSQFDQGYTQRTTYTYDYDEQGNWTKRIGLMDGAEIPYEIVERVITYY